MKPGEGSRLGRALTAIPRRYGEWVVRWRWPVLVLSLALPLALTFLGAGQRYYNPYDMWFQPDDPALAEYRQFARQYGAEGEDVVVIAFRDDAGIFTNRALEAVIELTERLTATQLVDKVTSVANYQYIDARPGAKDDALVIGDLVRRNELPLSPHELRRRQAIASGEAPIRGSLLSSARSMPTATALVARVKATGEYPGKVVANILAVVREVEGKYGYRMYLAGVPVVEHAFENFGRTETITFTSALLAVVVVLLGVIFRALFAVVLPCAVVLLAIGSALGAMILVGIWLNPLTTIIPQILITVAIAEAVHIVATYVGLRRSGVEQAQAVVTAVEENFGPCLVTSVTTAFGFASLVTGSLVPMRELGIGATTGTLVAFVLTFSFLPAALAIWPGRGPARRGPDTSVTGPPGRLEAILDGLARVSVRHPWPVMLGVLSVFVVIMAFAARLHVETAYQNMFKPTTDLRQGLAFIEANLGGSEDVEVSLDSGRTDGVKDPVFLTKVSEIQEFLRSLPYVTQTFSIVDILKRMNQVMHEEAPGTDRLPDSRNLAAQYLLLYTLSSSEDLKDRIDIDNRSTRVTARVHVQSARDTQAMGERIRAHIERHHPDLRAIVTSRPLLYTTIQEDLAANTVTAFLTAFVPITLMLALVFRNVRMALLATVPNVLPIVAMVGLMGLFRIPLDPGSAMVASVAIGIVIDDTVHFFSRYIASRRAGIEPAESMRRTLQGVGRPVIYTTFILAAGFSLFSFSHFNFIAYFGQLAAAVIVLALVADLLLTPALLTAFDRHRAGVTGPVPGGQLAKLSLAIVALGLTIFGSVVTVGADSAEERGLGIMKTQEEINRGYGSEVALLRMTLFSASRSHSERTLELRTLEGVRGGGDKTLIVFKAPADINGTGLLTHQQRTGDDDQWLYLPALKRTKRIASSNRSSSFVGSEFSYEDLVPLELAKYRFRYLRDDTVEGTGVWVVEAVPQIEDSGYSRMELSIQKDNHQTIRTVFFDKKKELLKTRTFDRWSRIEGKWWRAHVVRMENVQTGKATVLETLSITLRAGLSPREFTTRALAR